MGKFVFDKLGLEEALRLDSECLNFYISKNKLAKQQVVENKFSVEHGCSEEKVDMFAIGSIRDGVKSFIDIENAIGKDNYRMCFSKLSEADSGFYEMYKVLHFLDEGKVPYDAIMVVVRIQSDYALDTQSNGVNSYIWRICSAELDAFLEDNPSISGFIAKTGVSVGEDYKKDIIEALMKANDGGRLSAYLMNKYIKAVDSYVYDPNKIEWLDEESGEGRVVLDEQ